MRFSFDFIKLQSMRIFFLVLLLILNVYAEAKNSGSISRRDKKSKSAVVHKKSTKTSAKGPATSKSTSGKETSVKSASSGSSLGYEAQDGDALPTNFSNSTISTNSVTDTASDVVIVRDTIVDTIYVVMPDAESSRQKSKRYNIPLPRQSAFLSEGISVGIGAGLFNASKDCDCLGVWQGQLEYHYKDYVTGGIDVRFFGGTLDHDVMLMYQRYRLNARIHKSFSGADFYASALLGLETTDLSEFRKELHEGVHKNHSDGVDSTKTEVSASEESLDGQDPSEDASDGKNIDPEKNCEKMFSLDGFTLGFEAGMGVALSRYFGITGSATYEFNLSWAQLVTFSPGVAFNLQEVWPWSYRNLRSTWVSFEMVFQRYFNRGVKEWAIAGFVGVQVGI